jgi:hypothetical protein
MGARAWLAGGLFALGVGLVANALLGPLAVGAIEYHYSETLVNQAIGLDAVALGLAAPLGLLSAVLVLRRHPAGPVLACAPAAFAAYMMPQYVVGPDYLGLPGNNERFFALHFAVFVLAVTTGVLAWVAVREEAAVVRVPGRRAVIALLLVFPLFLLVGLHLPGFQDALSGEPSRSEYLDNPTAFWLIAFLDLAMVAPAAFAAGVGLLRNAAWGARATYAVAGWLSLVPPSVAAMAVSMVVNDDPNGSNGRAAGFVAFAVAFGLVAVLLYRPLFGRPAGRSGAERATGAHARTGASACPMSPHHRRVTASPTRRCRRCTASGCGWNTASCSWTPRRSRSSPAWMAS